MGVNMESPKSKMYKIIIDLIASTLTITKNTVTYFSGFKSVNGRLMPKFKAVHINTDYEIPYLAGYSVKGDMIYIDKRLPRRLKTKSGRVIDLFKYLVVHEIVEKYLEDHKHYKYAYAHELATGEERNAVERDNVNWDEYQNYMLKMVQQLKTFSGSLPLDLDTKPERDSHDYYRYHKIQKLKTLRAF